MNVACFFDFKLIVSFVAICCLNCFAVEWTTNEHYSNKLPVMKPFLDITARTSVECFGACSMNESKCDSVAYSEAMSRCRLYSHPTLKMPLPPLKPDPDSESQVFYKRNFCPPGWEFEAFSNRCYFVGSTALQRPAAWEVCDEMYQSELVTFQTAFQRNSLYAVLKEKFANIAKFFTGYSLFDNRLWPRPVPYFPNYVVRRGDCAGNNLPGVTLPSLSLEQCALKCDRTYRDSCVSFTWSRHNGQCVLKTKSCDNVNFAANPLTSNLFSFDKIETTRPPSLSNNNNCAGNDLLEIQQSTRWECYQACRSIPRCVAYSWLSTTRRCLLKHATCIDKVALTNSQYYDMQEVVDDSNGCPFGLRYHDVCLTYIRQSKTHANSLNDCRKMGAILTRPIERKQKLPMIYALQGVNTPAHHLYNFKVWIDLSDAIQEGIWRTTVDSENFTDSAVYDPWPWFPGYPEYSTVYNCAQTWRNPDNWTEGVCSIENDCPDDRQSACESPVSQWWPMTCRFTPPGSEYMGTQSKTISGVLCRKWNSTSYSGQWRNFAEWHTDHNFCRNPDHSFSANSVWCIRDSDGTTKEVCDPVPLCPEVDWAPNQNYQNLRRPYALISASSSADDHYDWTVEDVAVAANPICMMPADVKWWCPMFHRGSCYRIFTLMKNRTQAKTSCESLGWHLVTITSESEQFFLAGKLMSHGRRFAVPPRGYWTGLTGTNATGFVWDNSEAYSYGLWQSGQPNGGNQTCITMAATTAIEGRWTDEECRRMAFYICEFDLGTM